MPVSQRRDVLRRLAALIATLLSVALWPGVSWGKDRIQLNRAELVQRQEAYHLIGGYEINLGSTLEDALQRGVTLTFTQIFESDRPRDFWLAEDIVVTQRAFKLSYNALLRNYQLSVPATSNTPALPIQTFERLPEAIATLGDFRDWPVLERKQLNKKNFYRGRVRMFLDTSQLPKPLQINAVASSRWELDSGWHEWTFKP